MRRCQLCGDLKCDCLAQLQAEAADGHNEHDAARDRLTAQVARFLSSGGMIEAVQQGATGNRKLLSDFAMTRNASFKVVGSGQG